MRKTITQFFSNNKTIIDNILSLGFLQMANYILPLIVLPYLVIVLGVDKFGVLVFALAVIHYFNILIEYGFNLSATREIAINRDNLDKISKVFLSVIIIKFLLFVISFFLLSLLILIFDRLSNELYVYYFTFLMLFGKVVFPVWYFQGIEKMRYIALLNTIPKIVATLTIFVFIKEPNDYIYVPLINSLGFLFGGLIALIIALKSIKFVRPSISNVMYTLKESHSLFLANLSITLFSASNVIILGLFTSEHTVGVYSSIEKLVSAAKNMFVPIYQGVFPWLTKKEVGNIKKSITKLAYVVSAMSFSIFLVTFIFSESILKLIYDNEEIASYHYILRILSIIVFFGALNILYNYLYLNSIKAYNTRLKIFFTAGVFNIALGVILTYNYSVYGMATSFMLTELLLLSLGLYYFNRKNPE